MGLGVNKRAEIKWSLIGLAGKLLIDLIFASARIDRVGFEGVRPLIDSRKFILAAWHARILLPSYAYKGWGGVALVSASEDGEIIARVLARQGHEAVRGSSTRGGLRALSAMIKCLNDDVKPSVIIPDGPQGPACKVQPGVILLAKKTGYPIIPISYSARPIKVFASWDRFILPYPLARCRMIYGRPLYVPREADRKAESVYQRRLEKEMCRITDQADRYFGHSIR